MTVPTQPTSTTIATAAYQLYARRAPSTAEISYVDGYLLEEVKSDIMDRAVNWTFLRKTAYQPITQFLSTYSAPSDYKKLISVRLMKGTRSGTAQAGAATTITLASTDGGGAETNGKWIVITGGTGAKQGLQCKSFDTSTKVATMETSWATTPDNTSTYLVVDLFKPMKLLTNYERENLVYPGKQFEPTTVFQLANTTTGNLVLDSSPDLTTYALEILYYADLVKMDTDQSANPLYAEVFKLLNGLLIQGVYTKLCQQDSRYQIQLANYEAKLAKTESMYLYPNNESGFHVQIDY